jgi:hypothetical protein
MLLTPFCFQHRVLFQLPPPPFAFAQRTRYGRLCLPYVLPDEGRLDNTLGWVIVDVRRSYVPHLKPAIIALLPLGARGAIIRIAREMSRPRDFFRGKNGSSRGLD